MGTVALEMAEKCQYLGVQALALLHLGLCEEAGGDHRGAIDLSPKARDMMTRYEMAPDRVRCDAALARVRGSSGFAGQS